MYGRRFCPELLISFSFLEQSPRGLDRHQHHAVAEWRVQKALPLIKPDRVVVDGVGNDAAGTGYLGGLGAAPHGVHKQCRSDAGALQSAIYGETADQQ